MKPEVSIVLPTINAPTLRQVLGSIFRWTPLPYELFVICDSPDETRWQLFSQVAFHEGVHIITNPKCFGAPYALNQGIALAKGDYILFTSDDYLAQRGWIENLVKALKIKPQFGIAVTSKGERGQFPGAMMITREVLEKVGIFDEYLPVLGCDVDYYIRCLDKGFCPIGVVESLVLDLKGETIYQKVTSDIDDPVRKAALSRILEKHGSAWRFGNIYYNPFPGVENADY